MSTPYHADVNEIRRFLSALFRYAEDGTFISLRSFDQFDRGTTPKILRPLRINGSFEALVREAAVAAEDTAQLDEPSVFCPPIATFKGGYHARTADLANGLTLSVELDGVDPDEARERLQGILGPVTVEVRSGSEWINPETGEIQPNVHLHWRLNEPTTTDDDHARLRQVRNLATLLTGGDPTGKPIVHPLRWPGSWNLKSTPRMAVISVFNEAAEISLSDALEALETAMEATGEKRHAEMPGASSTPEARLSDVRSAMSVITNPEPDVEADPSPGASYNAWIRMGYAVHRATGGGQEGFEIWDNWSRLSDRYNLKDDTRAAWLRIAAALRGPAPPSTIGAGTIFFKAMKAGWVRPFPLGSKGAGPIPEQDNEPGHAGTQDVPSGLPLLWFSDIQPNLDAADFVEGVLIEGGMSVIYGESNCGKTFFMTDLGLHVALADTWRGRAVERGCVIYCALEGSHGISNRVAAFRIHHKVTVADVPFAVIPSAINMLDPAADTPRLIAAVETAAAKVNLPVRLVVIDTLSRAMAGGNENAPDDMGALVSNTDKVRQATGAHVGFVHHSGKDAAKGARGHSLLRAATDTEIEITRPDNASPSTASVTKQREMEIEGQWTFRLEVVNLGTNRRGKMVTSCVVVDVDADEQPTARLRGIPEGSAGVALLALQAAMASPESAIIPPVGNVPHDTRGVNIEVWRHYFYERIPAISPEARRKAFQRATVYLTKRGYTGSKDPWVWLT